MAKAKKNNDIDRKLNKLSETFYTKISLAISGWNMLVL